VAAQPGRDAELCPLPRWWLLGPQVFPTGWSGMDRCAVWLRRRGRPTPH